MGALYLALLYLATAGLLTWGVRPGGRRATAVSAAVLALLPLAFTAAGFLPGRTLAPTNALAGVAPWADGERVASIEAGSGPKNPLLLDPLAQMIPWQRAAREGLLFNPAQGGGSALLGNGQSAVLFPTEIAARLLSPFRGVTYSQAARLLLAAWGMFLLLRILEIREAGALLAATAYLGSAFLQLWRLHPHSLVAAATPWILAGVVALVRRPGPAAAAGLAVAAAVGVAAGHGETLFHAALFAAVLGIALWLRPGMVAEGEPGGPARWKILSWAAAAATTALLLAAPILLPVLENLEVGAELAHRRAGITDWIEVPLGEALARLAPALAPFAFGDPRTGEEGGPENAVELGGGAVGAAALLLIPAALFAGRRRGLSRGIFALGALGLLVSVHVPILSKLFGALPLLELTLLKRLSLWWALAVPVLAALGLEALESEGDRRRVRRALGAGLALTGAALAAVAWGVPSSRSFGAVGLEVGSLLMAFAAFVSIGGVRWPPFDARARRPGRVIGLALIVAAFLLPRAALFSRWVPVTGGAAFYPETLATRFVAERLSAGSEGSRLGLRVAGLDAALLPHAAVFFGLEDARANDPITFAPYAAFLEGLGEARPGAGVRLLDPAHPGLAFLGVRYVFDHPSMTHRPGVEVVYAGADAIVYENPRALPRVFLPRSVRLVQDEKRALAEALEIDDFAERAIVTGRDLPPAGEAPNGATSLAFERHGPRRLRVSVRARDLGLVATSQPAIPGWRVWLDGEEVEAVLVNGAFLGVVVPAGESRLELVYAPRSWFVGRILGGLGAAVLGGLLLSARVRRRRGGSAAPNQVVPDLLIAERLLSRPAATRAAPPAR